ncbi:hypothetical protein GCM10027053_47890 [Intrasporangium mesophilum]
MEGADVRSAPSTNAPHRTQGACSPRPGPCARGKLERCPWQVNALTARAGPSPGHRNLTNVCYAADERMLLSQLELEAIGPAEVKVLLCGLLEDPNNAGEERITKAFSAPTGTEPDDADRTGHVSQQPVAKGGKVTAVELTELQLPLQGTMHVRLALDNVTVDHDFRHGRNL